MENAALERFRKYTDEATFKKIVQYDTVAEMWEHTAAENADVIAIEDAGLQYTYRKLDDDVAHFRTCISGRGARVGLLVANSYDFVKAFLAVVTSGCTAVILPPQLPAEAVFGCAMKFGLSQLIYAAPTKEKTAILAQNRPDVVLTDAAEMPKGSAGAVKADGASPCVIMFTGGTTGKSKGALLSNAAVMQGVVNGCYGYRDVFRQRYLVVLPFFHVFGLIRNLLTGLYTGSTVFICRNNKDMFGDIARFRPTVLVLVPALANMGLMLSRQFGKNMMGDDLKTIICGAAPVPPYLITEYHKIGVSLLPGYGLTESANLVSGNPEALSHPDSVGYFFPNQEYRIENGELWLKGRNMMDGYVGEDNAAAYTDGWFKTGDLVRVDQDGFLYITGRIKEIIILGSGENISPAEVEVKFNALPFVQDSQVFESTDEAGAPILALEIVPRMSEIPADEKDRADAYMLDALNKVNMTLPPFERVSRIKIRESDFERSPSMKIVRYKHDKN